jgi:hypothetical protein
MVVKQRISFSKFNSERKITTLMRNNWNPTDENETRGIQTFALARLDSARFLVFPRVAIISKENVSVASFGARFHSTLSVGTHP